MNPILIKGGKLMKKGKGLLVLLVILALLFSFSTLVANASDKTLIVALPSDVGTMDWHFISGSARSVVVNVLDWQFLGWDTKIVDGQAMVDTSTMVPRIINEWRTEILPDGRAKHIFQLREGEVFHSGNPIRAEDIVWTMERRAGTNKDHLHRSLGGMHTYEELEETITIIDDYTFEVLTKKAMPLFWDLWAQRVYFDKKLALELAEPDDIWAQDVLRVVGAGSGPYKLKEWTPGVEVILERFEDYWGPKPYFETIIFKIVPDISARAMMLRTGAVDIAEGLPSHEISQLQNAPGIQVIRAPSMTQVLIGMNSNHPPLDNQLVRHALSYAFPYEEIIEGIYLGEAQRQFGPVPTGMEGHWAEPYFDTDLAKAKELLSEAGYDDGLELTLYFGDHSPDYEQIGALFQSSLGRIGVKLHLRQLPRGQFETQALNHELPMVIREGLGYIWDPAYNLHTWFDTDSWVAPAKYSNPRVDKLLDMALEEIDADLRNAYVKEAQELIAYDCPVIFVAQPNFVLPVRDNLAGYIYQNTEFNHLWLLRRK